MNYTIGPVPPVPPPMPPQSVTIINAPSQFSVTRVLAPNGPERYTLSGNIILSTQSIPLPDGIINGSGIYDKYLKQYVFSIVVTQNVVDSNNNTYQRHFTLLIYIEVLKSGVCYQNYNPKLRIGATITGSNAYNGSSQSFITLNGAFSGEFN